jgi:hypothetical protein
MVTVACVVWVGCGWVGWMGIWGTDHHNMIILSYVMERLCGINRSTIHPSILPSINQSIDRPGQQAGGLS